MKYLTSKRQNIIVTLLFSNVCFVVYHYSGILGNAGMAAIILNWLPIIIGLMTVALYFIVRAISKKNTSYHKVFTDFPFLSALDATIQVSTCPTHQLLWDGKSLSFSCTPSLK